MKLLKKALEKYFSIWKSDNDEAGDWNMEVNTASDGHLAVAAALGLSSDVVLEYLSAGEAPVDALIR